jgi:hypothetical protein
MPMIHEAEASFVTIPSLTTEDYGGEWRENAEVQRSPELTTEDYGGEWREDSDRPNSQRKALREQGSMSAFCSLNS